MTDADYYQLHKDDEDEWGDAVERTSPARRRLSAMISVRLAPDEEQLVRDEAERRGESVSAFIRGAVLSRCGRAPRGAPPSSGPEA